MSVIIFEGVDKVYKTTTAKALLEMLKKGGDWEYIKGEHPETLRQVIDRAKTKIELITEQRDKSFILDRFEPTCDPIYRDLKKEAHGEVVELQNLLSCFTRWQHATVIVYLFGNPSKIAERFETDKEEFTKIEQIKDIQQRYFASSIALGAHPDVLTIEICVEGKTTEEIISEIFNGLMGNTRESDRHYLAENLKNA